MYIYNTCAHTHIYTHTLKERKNLTFESFSYNVCDSVPFRVI